jgi:hypothetical protein
MVVEVCELDDPREPSRRPRRNRDAVYVELVGLAWNMRQKLQGVQLNTGEALAPQLMVRAALPRAMRSATDRCDTAGPRFVLPRADAVPPFSLVLVIVATVVAFPDSTNTNTEATRRGRERPYPCPPPNRITRIG